MQQHSDFFYSQISFFFCFLTQRRRKGEKYETVYIHLPENTQDTSQNLFNKFEVLTSNWSVCDVTEVTLNVTTALINSKIL